MENTLAASLGRTSVTRVSFVSSTQCLGANLVWPISLQASWSRKTRRPNGYQLKHQASGWSVEAASTEKPRYDDSRCNDNRIYYDTNRGTLNSV